MRGRQVALAGGLALLICAEMAAWGRVEGKRDALELLAPEGADAEAVNSTRKIKVVPLEGVGIQLDWAWEQFLNQGR